MTKNDSSPNLRDVEKKRLCHVCKKYACYHDGEVWWCGILSDMGSFNMSGYCKSKKEIKK